MNIKEEILSKIPDKSKEICLKELDYLENTENLAGKKLINIVYELMQENFKGTENPYNSNVLYELGITSKKPEGEFNIIDKRVFARPSPPDVDTDFSYQHRHLILDFFVKKYGRNRVGNIATSGSLKLRSAITRVGKALDIADAFEKGKEQYKTENVEKVNEILLPIPKKGIIKVHDENGDEHIVKTIADAMRWFPDFKYYMEQYPELYKHATKVEGLLSNGSSHASGVVISDVPLEKVAPLRTTPGKDLVTQFPMEDLEYIGLIKFDILGLATLAIIDECLKSIKENIGVKLDIINLPLDDKKTYDLYKKGDLAGVFQCESYGMIDTCKKIGVDRFEDIMAAISLYRPGPMKYIENYANRKNGTEKIDYFHPSLDKFLKPILENQYGVLIYQENVMQICQQLAGMTPTKALIIIKGIGKKKEELILKGKELFISGCINRGIPKQVAERFWNDYIMPFSLYGFNVAHALSYAFDSYITAYLKANYPEEFMIANLNVFLDRREMEDILIFEKECKKMKIEILPRTLNDCDLKYKIVAKKDPLNGIMYSQIRPSIICKNMPSAASEEICQKKPFKDFVDLVQKTDPDKVTVDAIGALHDAGFFPKQKKDDLINKFKVIREDVKIEKKRGVVRQNIFDEE